MKKLMTTMLAVAVGVGLHAAGMANTGTSFEGLDAGAYDITATTGELSAQEAGQTYWVTNGTETLTVVDGVSVSAEYYNPGSPSRPAGFSGAQTRYLAVKTTLGNPVTRNVSVGGEGTSIGSGFYFDSLVKFTAFEGDQDVNLNGGKLAIWLQENLDDGTQEPVSTNLVVTAGYLLNEGVVATNYVCTLAGIDLSDGGWHRVTVKAIESIYGTDTVPGFVVFVDGVYATSTAAKGIEVSSLTDNAYAFNSDGALFPSAVQSGADKAKIAAVSFDGQGDVDDLIFTETAPAFAKDNEFFTIQLGANVDKVQYSLNGGSATTITETTRIAYVPSMYVEITYLSDSFASGYMSDGITTSAFVTEQDGYYFPGAAEQSITVNAKVAGATLNGEPVESLAAAFTTINAAASGNFTVVLNADADAGVSLENENVSVVLDLAGNDITADSGSEVVFVDDDCTLLITNSTVEVGHVIADGAGIAAVFAYGNVTIAGGCYDGAVDFSQANSALVTGGSFSVNDNKDPYSETLPPAPNADLAAAVMPGYEFEVVSQSTYYTLVAHQAATVNVTVTGGANATAVWTVNGSTVSAPATLTEGDEYEVVYTANTGYEYLLGAITTASGTAGTSDIAITISDAVAINYTITLDAGDGASVDPATTNYTVESGAITLPTPTTSLMGVTFGGWTNETVTTAITEYTPAAGDGNFTLYAKWDAVAPCTITLNAGEDATVSPSSINFWAGAGQAAITLPTPVLNQGVTGVTFGGWTNETITTAITEYTPPAENAESFTLYAKWDAVVPTYPSYIDTSDSTIKNQYDAWASTYSVSAGANDYETAFLLNVAPDTLGAKLATTDFAISGTTVTININRGNLNGYPYVKKAATVAGLASATAEAVTVVPADNIENGGRVTLTGESGTTQFYQIGVQVAPVAVPNAD